MATHCSMLAWSMLEVPCMFLKCIFFLSFDSVLNGSRLWQIGEDGALPQGVGNFCSRSQCHLQRNSQHAVLISP